ncbi:MAG TPA: GspMb/PilO family protein [Tepidisphaeraceae bacterium]|nr:GspMb/PilO family protein [Tepidisphaeraceae bacterium]
MILSKRERLAGIVTTAVLGLFAIDHFALQPLLDRRAQVQTDIDKQQELLVRATGLFANKNKLTVKWNDMLTTGMTSNASAAESQVLHAVRDWAQETSLSLSSVKPERTEQDKQFQRIVFRATGTGTMASIGGFLWKIQNSRIPIRITDMQIASRKDGVDDLTLQIGISTIYLSPEPEKPQAKPTPALAREDNQ